jgi:hypothetical protein
MSEPQAHLYIGRCKSCKRGLRTRAVREMPLRSSYRGDHWVLEAGNAPAVSDYGGELVLRTACPGCGGYLGLHRLRGVLNRAKKCSAKCTSATGHDCECACGGKNHGSNHG